MATGMEREWLEARIDDAISKQERGDLAHLSFLTPRDARRAEQYLRMRGVWEQAWLWGGYPNAEYTALFLLPAYLSDCLPFPPMECSPNDILEMLGEDVEDVVSAVRITGSGFRTLSHRDYLGAILHLGLERSALGDLAVQNEKEAILFCPKKFIPFLQEHLQRVASDAVRISPYVMAEDFTDGKKYQPISDTVASERLDCVVATLCNLSREGAQDAIRSGLVEVDFELNERVDTTLVAPTTITVRGYGRFILRAFLGKTQKGRIRLRADKMI